MEKRNYGSGKPAKSWSKGYKKQRKALQSNRNYGTTELRIHGVRFTDLQN